MQELSVMIGENGGKGRQSVEKAYYVYILRCRGGSLYTGLTNDLRHRMRLHCGGKGAKYTRAHPPEALEMLWRCGDKADAARLEYAIKERLERRQKLALIAAPEWANELLPGGAYEPLRGVTLERLLTPQAIGEKALL